MIVSSKKIGFNVEQIGLNNDYVFYFHFDYTKSSGSQALCKNGLIHPESEPIKIENLTIYCPELSVSNLESMITQESLNTIEAHVLLTINNAMIDT